MGIKVFMGKIYTQFKPIKIVECLIVSSGRVVYAGSDKLCEYVCKNTVCEYIDINGVALPGFVDAHIHMDALGINLNSIDLRNTRSIDEVKRLLRTYRNTIGHWIIGRGWDQEKFIEKRVITRWDIDNAINELPVLLIRICGHLGVINSRAIELLKLSKIFECSSKIDIANGIIKEEVLEYIWREIDIDVDSYRKILDDAQNHIVRHGVTSIGYLSVPISVVPVLISMDLENRLYIRIHLYFDAIHSDIFKILGLRRGYGDDYLRFMGIKIFIDGSLGARTALLSLPYGDDPNNFGIERISSDTLVHILSRAKDNGIDVALHAIGDRALDVAIYSIRSALSHNYTRIEHASIVRDDQLSKLKGFRIAIQPHFIISDFWMVDRVGIERARYVYRIKSLLDSDIVLGFSTDAPVEDVNPWKTIYAAVTRGIFEDIELAKYTYSEAIDVVEALHLYTKGSGQLLLRNDIGCLEPGCLADINIVDRDPISLDLHELKNIRSLKVFVGGKAVFL
ncbi:MAG: amidohydrolase [Ignisphaera sp.]